MFKDIFTPFAFETYTLELKSASQLETLDLPQTLCHIRTLNVEVYPHKPDTTFHDETEKTAELLVLFLRKIPNVRSLVCVRIANQPNVIVWY